MTRIVESVPTVTKVSRMAWPSRTIRQPNIDKWHDLSRAKCDVLFEIQRDDEVTAQSAKATLELGHVTSIAEARERISIARMMSEEQQLKAPFDWVVVKYEDLVADPEKTFDQLEAVLGARPTLDEEIRPNENDKYTSARGPSPDVVIEDEVFEAEESDDGDSTVAEAVAEDSSD